MNARAVVAGTSRTRRPVFAAAVAIPLVASVAFLLEYDVVLTAWPAYVALALAMYAGWARAGLASAWTLVFATVCWRFVVPPLVGYLRWSMDTRYTPPRLLAYKLGPRGELLEGITNGPFYALVAAAVVGSAAYLLGAGCRRVAAWATSEGDARG